MTLQEDFDALSADYHALKVEWETAKQNLLGPALITPGTLRFGGNIMELGKDGAQIVAPTDGAVGTGTIGLYWLPAFSPSPGLSNDSGAVFPRSTITGYASKAGVITAIYLASDSVFNDVQARVYSSASAGSASGGISAANSTASTFGAGVALAELVALDSETPEFDIWNAVLRLVGVTADPTTPADGMIWYRSDTDILYARINGVTTNIGSTGSILTDTAWAAGGDLVVGTGNDTAEILSVGLNGYVLTVDTAGGGAKVMNWKNPNVYGKWITTSQGQNLP